MKWHKYFAWATVFCFVMTMYTGINHGFKSPKVTGGED